MALFQCVLITNIRLLLIIIYLFFDYCYYYYITFAFCQSCLFRFSITRKISKGWWSQCPPHISFKRQGIYIYIYIYKNIYIYTFCFSFFLILSLSFIFSPFVYLRCECVEEGEGEGGVPGPLTNPCPHCHTVFILVFFGPLSFLLSLPFFLTYALLPFSAFLSFYFISYSLTVYLSPLSFFFSLFPFPSPHFLLFTLFSCFFHSSFLIFEPSPFRVLW